MNIILSPYITFNIIFITRVTAGDTIQLLSWNSADDNIRLSYNILDFLTVLSQQPVVGTTG
jgi:hypothetical protein